MKSKFFVCAGVLLFIEPCRSQKTERQKKNIGGYEKVMKQRSLRRKLFGFLLALVLVIGMIPGTSRVAYADPEGGTAAGGKTFLVTLLGNGNKEFTVSASGSLPFSEWKESLRVYGRFDKNEIYPRDGLSLGRYNESVLVCDENWNIHINGTGKTYIYVLQEEERNGRTYQNAIVRLGILVENGKEYIDWSEENSLPSAEGRYTLQHDVTLSESWNTPTGVTRLNLNGHTITVNCDNKDAIKVGSGCWVYINGDEQSAIKAGTPDTKGIVVEEYLEFYDGTISGFKDYGVNVNDGAFIMERGTVKGNSQGVLVQGYGSFELYESKILDNTFEGVNISGKEANFYAVESLISGNGVGVKRSGDNNGFTTASFAGVTITGNKSGAVLKSGIASISGSTVIKDNKNGSENSNLSLYPGAKLEITGLDEGAEIWVNKSFDGFFTNELHGNADEIVKYFKSDDGSKEIKFSDTTHRLYMTGDKTVTEGYWVPAGGSYNGKCIVVFNDQQYEADAFLYEHNTGDYEEEYITVYSNGESNKEYKYSEGEPSENTSEVGFRVTSIDENGIPTFVYGYADAEPEVIEWTPSASNPLPDESGTYKLMSDVAITGPWLVDGKNITIDLNGHKIIYTRSEDDKEDGWGAEVTNGAELTLTGKGTFTNHISFVDEPGMTTGIAVRNGGTLNIDGCAIENFTRGILLTAFESDTVFGSCNLISGEIRNGDWGVVVDCGTFTMTGGEITKHGTYGVDNHDKAFIKGGKILNNELKAVNTEEGATTEISESATVVNKKPAPTLTDDQKPTAIEKFNYDGKAHALVAAPKAALPEGYTMLYALGKSDKDTDIPGTGWDTAIPKGTEAGTYYVWAWPVGDEEHTSVEVFCLIAAIVPPTVAEDKVDTPTLETTTEAGSSSPAVSIKLYTEEATKLSTAKPAVKSHELVTENGIGIRFYVDLSMLSEEQKAAVKVNFTGGATSQAVFSDAVKDSIGNYGFTCLVNSTQIGNDITASIYYGGSEPVVDTYKVTDYTEKFENKTANEIAGTGASAATVAKVEKVVNLVNAVSDFGNAMNAIKDASTSNIGSTTAQTTIPETKVQQAAAALEDKTPEKTGSADIAKVTYTLTLGPKTSINFYVKALGQNVISSADVTVTKDSSPVTVTTGTDSKGRIKVTVSGIDAADLDDMYTITVTSGSNSFSMGVSALTYANYILNNYSGSQAAKQAAAALLLYNQAAEAMNN